MEDKSRKLAKDRQLFAGAMGAGLSHEISNVLAIIGELNGLLEDLSLAAGQEGITPSRLKKTTAKITTQVERGKVLAKLLNRFSHSPEIKEQSLEVADVVLHLISLCERMARLKRVTLQPAKLGSYTVYGDLFNLQHILFRCIEIGLLASPEETTIEADLKDGDDEVWLILRNGRTGGPTEEIEEKTTVAQQISLRLGGSLKIDLGPGPLNIELRLPSELYPLVR